MNHMKYKYKIRLRPDVGLTQPMPLPHQMNFTGDEHCPKVIYHPNPGIMAVGAEDTFNIGESDDMDNLLDRYVDLTTKPFIFRRWRDIRDWTSESYLMALMEERYHICLRSLDAIWMVVLRKPSHTKPIDKETISGEEVWVRLNSQTSCVSC